ncbi:phosphatase PAP2 family protein [Streptomyces sp. ICC4]|uniref:phosphatase PAP2 family protein n=1 Tax=Streptomyces sp. ICC4 TaxID=2099584 RepID=UPI001EF91FC2
MRGPWRLAVAGCLLLIPPAVGLARMYRGMHYPSDVAGGLLNGPATLPITGCALLYGRGSGPDPGRWARPRTVEGWTLSGPAGRTSNGPWSKATSAPCSWPRPRKAWSRSSSTPGRTGPRR